LIGLDFSQETKHDLKLLGILFCLLIFVSLVSLVLVRACAADECSITAAPGDWVRLDAYYWHEGGSYYSDQAGMVYPDGVTALYANGHGHPTAYSWNVNGHRVKQCGNIPVFHDKFELGDLDRWSSVTGG